MAGPVVQLRALQYRRTEQVKIKTIFERYTLIDLEEESKFEFCFKKGKIFGTKLENNSCAFLMQTEIKEKTDVSNKQGIEAKLRDKPEAFISIAAMCNQKEDHYLLAALTWGYYTTFSKR
jgi:hypothetical protein